MLVATRRLPGIRVAAAPPPAVEALPRMDVAVLVGFASTGPLHLPVAIESAAQFAAVFGPDAPLAWDQVSGERVHAYLGAAVRAFFSNGGRRCWVIRVARVGRDDGMNPMPAKSNRFAVPGVLELAADGSLRAAQTRARCEGSWSDGLSVACATQERTFSVEHFEVVSSPDSGRCTFYTHFGLRAGDLIALGDKTGRDKTGLCAYATVDTVEAAPNPVDPYKVRVTVRAVFERLMQIDSPFLSPAAVSPPPEWIGTAEVEGFGGPLRATLVPPVANGEQARLQFDDPIPANIEHGHWAQFKSSASTIWLRIDQIVERRPVFGDSPTALNSTVITATAIGPAWRELGAVVPFPADSVRRAQLVSLELRVDEVSRDPADDARRDNHSYRMNPVGLTPAHPSAWWDQWTDGDFYRPHEDLGAGRAKQPVPAQLPRLALARAEGAVPRAWIPLGVGPLFGPALARLAQEGTALERDGLSSFDASLFLDPELADASMHDIAALADSIRYLRQSTRTLLGLHAAWSIGAGGLFNEASLLAIPDAIHLGWDKRGIAESAPPVPPAADAPPHWYTHRGACVLPISESIEQPDFGAFLDCSTRKLATPQLDGPDAPVPPGAYRLTWNDAEPGASYVLLEATVPDFKNAREIQCGANTEYVATNAREGNYYYQVVAQVRDERSNGSDAVTVVVRSDDWVQKISGDSDHGMEREWLAIHRAALRMAAASGELFAVMTMPRHFHVQQALRYTQSLRAVRQPPGATEARVHSYGAMYFPWLQFSGQIVPPDGVALGVLAARASLRGAWIAPANEPMRNVEALTPVISSRDWQSLQDAQINLLRADPRGFLTLSADTLAVEVDLRPINVRRLLILLRRLALRRGISYVFEPNGPALRRAVERGFGILLADLFRRGAFAGATAEQSFRVVTDDTINTRQDAEAGRFIVELRVAPSVPMRFISVQLAQSGARITVREEL